MSRKKLGDIINKVDSSPVKGLQKDKPIESKKTNVKETRNARLQAMVLPSEKAALKEKRGHQSESDYIRELIIKDLNL